MYNPDSFPSGEATCALCGLPHCICDCSFNSFSYRNTHDKKKNEAVSVHDYEETPSEKTMSSPR
jgi:hypothetical protein